MPPMQKRALYFFIAAIAVSAALVPIVLLVIKPTLDSLFPLLLLMLAATTLVAFVPWYLTRPRPGQPVVEDERDKAIIEKAWRYSYVGTLATVAVWLLAFIWLYSDKGQVPFGVVMAIWPSLLVAVLVFSTAGIMIEYWRARSGFVLTRKWKAGMVVGYFILYVGLTAIGNVVRPDHTMQPPDISPRFTSTYTEVNVGVPVRFVDTSVGDVTGWEWDFGDNTTSREQNPTHAYTNPGQYTVWMTAYCKEGGVRETKENYITVLPSESP